MRSKSSFSFFTKITSSRRRPSFSIPNKRFESSEINRTIDHAAEIIEKWNTEYVYTTRFYSLFCESKRESKKFVKRVKDLQKAMDLLICEDPNSENLLRAQKLMQIAMKRLEKEFCQILSMNRAHLDPESASTRSSASSVVPNGDYDAWHESRSASDSVVEVEEVSKNSRKELRLIAECMIAAGYSKECASIYKSIRKSIVDEAIYRMGVERISSSKAKKMPCEVVELKTKSWREAVKVLMNTLFHGEKSLCDEVFQSSVSLRESCFRDISKEGSILLFGFPETLAVRDKKNPNPKKIFPLLDMYCTIIDNLSPIESIFSYESTFLVRSQAITSLRRLSESILSHLVGFESEIRKDSTKTMVHGEGVHPMTISAMDYISRLSDYNTTFIDILNGSSTSVKSLLPKSYFNVSETEESSASELKVRFAWLILVLLCKIDAKAELYKDFSTQYLFLANNLQHVVSHVRSTNLKQILGDEWIVKHSEKVRQFARSYERLTWGPVASACPSVSTTEAMEMSSEEAEMQFENFNEIFDRTRESQSACVVSDIKLLDEMRVSIGKKLLPKYRDFYNAHRNAVMLAGTDDEWNVKYTPEDIENHLLELFSGKGISENTFVCSPDSCPVIPIPSLRRKIRSVSCRRF
ncbi:unnamed protein product [Cochlearia groenlandica]